MGLLPPHYNVRNLRRVLAEPRMLRGELHRIGNRLNVRLHGLREDREGIDVADEDWDNLLLLDGCRYDVYERRTDLDGALRRVRSRGSDSWEFLRENFRGRRLHDTVYVTANPHAHRLAEGTFHAVVDLLADHWDPDLQTVPPGAVVEGTLRAHETYPHKRLLVHFMQPHFPFIGETGRRLDQGGIEMNVDGADHDDEMIWTKLQYGLVDEGRVRRAYRENVDLALGAVEDLLAELPGRTVVSSDHGNLIGERLRPIPTRGYGHPRGMYVPELLEVPWHVVAESPRREVRADPPEAADRPDEAVLQRRLRELGYA